MAGIVARGHLELKPDTVYVGVDAGLEENAATVLTERGQQLDRFQFSTDRQGYTYMRKRLERVLERQGSGQLLVGMEPTNYFWKLLVAELEEHEIPYCLVNAFTVHRRREGDNLDRSKTDELDADTVADLVRTGKYTETRLLHGEYAELRQCVTLCHRLKHDAARQKNMVRAAIGQIFPELPTVFKDWGQTMVAMIRNHAAAVRVREMDENEFVAAVRADYHGARLMVGKLLQAHNLAKDSIGLRDGVASLQLTARLHVETWEQLEAQHIYAEDSALATFYGMPQAEYLLSVPHLGDMTAATILAEIGDPSNYHRADQLIKLAGTQPAPNLSGRKTRSRTPMSRKGRPLLRTMLYLAVLRLIQTDPSFSKRYKELQERKNSSLEKMQAIGVLMNKLLRILWSLMRNKTLYDPAWAERR
jgi:transposase